MEKLNTEMKLRWYKEHTAIMEKIVTLKGDTLKQAQYTIVALPQFIEDVYNAGYEQAVKDLSAISNLTKLN